MHDDFGVAAAFELVAQAQQVLTQGAVVIDLAVKHYPKGSLLIGHRLGCCRRQIDDAQPPVDQAARALLPDRTFVRPSVDDGTFHCAQNRLLRGAMNINVSGYATHSSGCRQEIGCLASALA